MTRPPQYGLPIALADAKRVMAAAEAEANANDWPMSIAIVDAGGQLVMFHRIDDARNGSVTVARQKAETAVNFKLPTRVFEEAVAQGGLDLRLLAARNLTPLEGGLPLMKDGKIIGAIGVAGMESTQDGQVAQAGAAAL
jgi:glc operon protein GlcG